MTLPFPATKAILTHRNDTRKDLIALLCKKREVQSRRQIVALTALGTRSLGDIVILLSALPLLDAFCKRVGIVDEPVISKHRRTSELGSRVFWAKACNMRKLLSGGFSVR